MTNEKPDQDRRRYYRLQPAPEAEPQVTFEFEKQTLEVRLVNISPGGLLCYVDETVRVMMAEMLIPKITIVLPHKKPVTYSGKVVRVQATSETGKQFCAVEFIRFDKKILHKGSKPLHQAVAEIDNQIFLQRLSTLQHSPAASIVDELTQTISIYDAFAVEAKRLPLEERWYFYEILDEMTRHQPEYPPALAQEFCRLCRGEDRSEFVLTAKSQHRWQRFWKRLLPN